MTQAKKLIEVAMPIKEISAESVRDKSIRHGHISTLHLWWARRPLPVCRAVVFASLVPDPLDENCPQVFRDAVEFLLGEATNKNIGDPYKPYLDIPWTSIYDPMEDNLRNRLQMFIGKFTDEMQQHLLHNKPKPDAGKLLTAHSLIKWDNKNNEHILNIARKLIWVAHNSTQNPPNLEGSAGLINALADFDSHFQAIKSSEEALFNLTNRHLISEAAHLLENARTKAIDAFLSNMPKVFDPFAGGGAIPLEAARLGCHSFGNDINPVAHIIQKGSLEFPQKYGKPIRYSKSQFIELYGEQEFYMIENERKIYENGEAIAVQIDNRLSFDVAFYAQKLLAAAEKEIGHFYPADEKGNKPIAYYWARVGTCSNPSCKAEVPLLKGFYLCNTPRKQVYLHPIINGTQIDFEIKYGKCELEGWNHRGNLKCPCCKNITDVKIIKQQSINNTWTQRLLAVIQEGDKRKVASFTPFGEAPEGKAYRLPSLTEIERVNNIPEVERPTEKMQRNSAGGDTFSWGITEWGQMFSPRQLLAIQTLVAKLQELKSALSPNESEYSKAIVTYLGILIDRITISNTTFGRWHTTGEKLEHPFSKQAIPMMFDYPESYMFCHSTGSAYNQLDWLTRYIESECNYSFAVDLKNASSGDKAQFSTKYLSAVITDPPYYDAIAYADLSDFFYVWLKKSLGDVYPLNFATPQTPKTEECTALKHHHNGNHENAKQHFEKKLTQIFDAIEHQTADIVSIMFAHQSTEAWTTLCNSVLGANMNITGSWAMDTEMANRSLGIAGAVLESSVTIACKPSQKEGYGSYKIVKKAIEATVEREVNELYRLGFRGADLLTACFGKAVSEFGRYQKVEKADGSEVSVADLLEMAKESAFNALLKGFDGDDFTKFYIAWLQLYGFVESDFDDAAKFSRVGLSINVQDLFAEHILLKNGNKQTLGNFAQRVAENKHLGEKIDSFLIDQVHKAMYLYQGANRSTLLQYIGKVGVSPESNFWRVLTSIDELLPKGCTDQEQSKGLIANKNSLIRESKEVQAPKTTQIEFEF